MAADDGEGIHNVGGVLAGYTIEMEVKGIEGGDSVTEGNDAVFTLRASHAPTGDVEVGVTVQNLTGEFAAMTGTYTVTIAGGSDSGTLSVGTVTNKKDEHDGSIHASLQSGTGYSIGNPSSASVTVTDDDPSPLMFTGEVEDVKAVRGQTFNSGTLPEATGGILPYSYWTSNLPPNLTFDNSSRTIAGTPSAAGSWTVRYHVRDDATEGPLGPRSQTTSTTFTITVVEPVTLPTVDDMTGTVGVYFEESVPEASDGCDPYVYEISGLPPGLEFQTSPLRIRGTATTEGVYSVTYKVTDALMSSYSRSFTITILEPAPPIITVERGTGPTVREGYPVMFTIRADREAATDLTITLDVETTGMFLQNTTPPSSFRLPQGDTKIDLVWNTRDDQDDEFHGTVKVTVTGQADDGYAIGSPAVQEVTIIDDDDPIVTITADSASVKEGDPMTFTLEADRMPKGALRVGIEIKDPGGYLDPDTPIPTVVWFIGRAESATLTLHTATVDGMDEPHGTVTVTLEPDSHPDTHGEVDYVPGAPDSASVLVEDQDKPPAPTNLRANGDLDGDAVNGIVTLRWNAVDDATSYNVYSAGVECIDVGVVETMYVCVAGNEIPHPEATITGTEAKVHIGGHGGLYRVWVTAVNVDESDPSVHAFVVPTVSPSVDTVATIPIATYAEDGEFDYTVCDPDQAPSENYEPRQLPTWFRDSVHGIIAKWPAAVVWESSGRNIIRTTGRFVSDCVDDPFQSYNQVYFFHDAAATFYCDYNPATAACFAYRDRGGLTTPGVGYQYIVIRDNGQQNIVTAGCTLFAKALLHEVGHAFGVGEGGKDVPEERKHAQIARSAMASPPALCYPTEYDVAAMMRLYQSR